jgi:hypothetical protein
MRIAVTTLTKELLASFKVLHLTAKNRKSHTIGRTLSIPAAMKMCEIMHGEKYGEALETVPLIIQQCNASNRCQKTSRNNCRPGLNAVKNFLFKSTNQ